MEKALDASEVKQNDSYSIGRLVSSAVFLSVIGVASQVILLSYQIAFLGHFNVPPYLVEASISKNLKSGFMLFGVALYGWNLLGWFTEDYLRPNGKVRSNESLLLYTGLGVIGVCMYLGGIEVNSVLLFTFCLFLLICLSLRNYRGLLADLQQKPQKSIGFVLLIGLTVIAIPGALGGHFAKQHREFWVFEESGKSFAAIERYGDYLVAIPHDRVQNTLGPGFKLIKMENLTETLVLEKLMKPPKVVE